MRRSRVLLANEFGAGRGHLSTLRRMAQAIGPDCDYDAALCRRQYEGILTSIGATVFQGPCLMYHNRRRSGVTGIRTATWGEFLGDLGFADPQRLVQIVDWWRLVLVDRQISLVVADYAPLAVLAARTLGVGTLFTGTGFGLPPWQMPDFPLLRPEDTTRLHDEAALLENVNALVRRHSLAPLRGLPEVYRADVDLVSTLPFLDPYAAWRQGPYLPPISEISSALAGGGDEVFVYFSTHELEDAALVQALADLPLPRRGHLPGAAPEVLARLAASGMILEDRPVPVDLIARRSRVLLTSGQHGIVSLGLYAGLAQVCLPLHQEHLWHGRAACAQGVGVTLPIWGRTAADITGAIETVYNDAALFARATQVAAGLRADLDGDPATIAARVIRPLVQPYLRLP